MSEISKSYTQDDEATKKRFEDGYKRVFEKQRDVELSKDQNPIQLELERYKLEMIIHALEDWKPSSWQGKAFTEYVKLKAYLKSVL